MRHSTDHPRERVVESGPVSIGVMSERPMFAVAAVFVGAILANVDPRLFALGLADLRGKMSLSFDEAAWLSTATMASQILVAPAVAWMATVFGLRRVLGVPAFIYAGISVLIPFLREYHALLFFHILHGLLLGTFVPATLLIIFKNLPVKYWIPAIALYAIRIGFTLNSGVAITGFYVEHLGWQWIYWQDALIAPALSLLVYLGSPQEPVNREVLRDADWGGMLLFGAGVAMTYAGLDQGNRLDWLESGTITALITAGAALITCFFINEVVVEKPWAHIEVLLSRNMGLALLTMLLYQLTSLSNSFLVTSFLTTVAQLKSDQIGPLLLTWVILPMVFWFPLSIYLVRRCDVRFTLVLGIAAFAAAGLLGTNLSSVWSTGDFIWIVLLQSVGQSFTLLSVIVIAISNSNPNRATAFAAYIQVMRLGGAEIGLALMSTWLRSREQLHSHLIGLHVVSGNSEVSSTLTKLTTLFSGHGEAMAPARSISFLSLMVQHQAHTLAFIDAFWLTFWFAVLALVCASCIRKAPNGPFSPRFNETVITRPIPQDAAHV